MYRDYRQAFNILTTLARYFFNLPFIYSRFSRSRQLGGLVPVHRLGVPLRCKAKLSVDKSFLMLKCSQ